MLFCERYFLLSLLIVFQIVFKGAVNVTEIKILCLLCLLFQVNQNTKYRACSILIYCLQNSLLSALWWSMILPLLKDFFQIFKKDKLFSSKDAALQVYKMSVCIWQLKACMPYLWQLTSCMCLVKFPNTHSEQLTRTLQCLFI